MIGLQMAFPRQNAFFGQSSQNCRVKQIVYNEVAYIKLCKNEQTTISLHGIPSLFKGIWSGSSGR